MNYLFSIFFIIAVFFVWRYLFKKFKILDRPGADLKWVRWPVPTLMWVFAYISFVLNDLVFPGTSSNTCFEACFMSPSTLAVEIHRRIDTWRVKFRILRFQLVSHIWWAIIGARLGKRSLTRTNFWFFVRYIHNMFL